MTATVHIVGAGLAGLSAAVRLTQAGRPVVVYEALDQAGGRCRSYYDHATGLTIDNGNHLLLSGNGAALDYLGTIGSRARLIGPDTAEFPFLDLASGERWRLKMSGGRMPWWIFASNRRPPGTSLREFAGFRRLLSGKPGETVADVAACEGPLYERLVRPLLLAALNIEPREASATLAATIVRETLLAGGAACRPLIAREGLSAVLVEPALAFLRGKGVNIRFGHELRALTFAGERVVGLDFGADTVELAGKDALILAVPPHAARAIVPGLRTPERYRAIVNAHFRLDPRPHLPPLMGLLNSTVEWIFAFPDRLSVTISAADRLLGAPREELAATLWGEVAAAHGLGGSLPPWQIVRERRATFAATPEDDARRPAAATAWRNLLLAGDWTQTGLPATIEGSIRSGHRAADLAGRTTA